MNPLSNFCRIYSALQRTFSFTPKYKLLLFIIAGLTVLEVVSNFSQPWTLQKFLDNLNNGIFEGSLLTILVGLVVLHSIISALYEA